MTLNTKNKIKNLIVAVTNRCNLRCKMCTIWKENEKKDIDAYTIKKIFNSKYLDDDFSLTLTGGEPFLSPKFQDIIKEILVFKPEALKTVSTNGVTTEKILEFLRKYKGKFPNLSLSISFDGIHKNDLQRGKSKAKIMDTIERLKKEFPKMLIKVKLTITPINYDDIIPTYEYCKKVGIKFKVKLSESATNYTNKLEPWQPVWTEQMKKSIKNDLMKIGGEKVDSDEKSADFIKRTIMAMDSELHLKQCLAPFERIFVMPDCSVYSCIHLKKLGDIIDKKLCTIPKRIHSSDYINGVDNSAKEILKLLKINIKELQDLCFKSLKQAVNQSNKVLSDNLSKIAFNKGMVFVVGWGKSVDLFIKTMLSHIPKDKLAGCKYMSLKPDLKEGNVERINATHPILSKKNIQGSMKLLNFIKKAKEKDIVLILSTGGGSSMFEVLDSKVSLEQAKKTIKILLKNNVDCRLVNYTRRCCSEVKGGKLLRFVRAKRIITFILSDDILTGGKQRCAMHVASGPTKTYSLLGKQQKDMLKKLKDIKVTSILPDKLFSQTDSKRQLKSEKRVKHIVIFDNKRLINIIKKNLRALGIETKIRVTPYFDESSDVARQLFDEFKSLVDDNSKRPLAYICGGESTVNVKGRGKGGRVQELIGYLIKPLSKIPNSFVVGFGSDGQDYLKGIAGACADNNTYATAKKILNNCLNNNDTYHLHKELGSLIKSPQKKITVGDIIILFKN